jgi:hypothetical protein
MFTDALPKLGVDVDAGGFGFDSLRHHVSTTRSWIREGLCAVRGHDLLLQFTHDRMFLQCSTCGHETGGWHIDVRSNARPSSRLR